MSYLHDPLPGSAGRISVLSTASSQCWWFQSMPDTVPGRPAALAVACTDGLYEIQDLKTAVIKAPEDGTYRAAFLLRSKADPTRMWVGLFDGLASFRRVNGKWVDEGRIEAIRDEVRTLVENPDGSLWVGTSNTGLVRVSFASRPTPDDPRPAPSSIERFGVKDGLPPSGVAVVTLGGVPYFAPWGGSRDYIVATYDAASRTFVRDRSFDQAGIDRFRVGFGLLESPDGRVYANLGKGTAVARRAADGSWSFDKSVFSRFGQEPMGLIYQEPDGMAWFNWQNALVRFDLSSPPAAPIAFRALVRRVTTDARASALRRRRVAGVAAAACHHGQRPDRVRRPDLPRRDRHGVPDAARGTRRRLDVVDQGRAARLHEPGGRRLSLPCPRAQLRGSHQRRSVVRLHDPAAVVSNLVGVRGLPADGRVASRSASIGSSGRG